MDVELEASGAMIAQQKIGYRRIAILMDIAMIGRMSLLL
jgi:hypothetical protein